MRTRAAEVECCAVVPRFEQGIGERADEDLLDKLVHQSSAAAVREKRLRKFTDPLGESSLEGSPGFCSTFLEVKRRAVHYTDTEDTEGAQRSQRSSEEFSNKL
jgi:hypothetical protein